MYFQICELLRGDLPRLLLISHQSQFVGDVSYEHKNTCSNFSTTLHVSTVSIVTYSVHLFVYSGIVCGNSLYSCRSLPFCTRPINERGYYFYSEYLFLFHHRCSMSRNMLQLSFQQALSQHFAFTTCMFVFITLFFIGVHHRVMEPTM